MSEVRFTVPLTPPSANHYVKHTRAGRHYLTKEAVAFIDAVCIFAGRQKMEGKAYQLDIQVFYGKGERGDLDNRGKIVQDALQKAGVIRNDSQIRALSMGKHRDWERPRTEIKVSTL